MLPKRMILERWDNATKHIILTGVNHHLSLKCYLLTFCGEQHYILVFHFIVFLHYFILLFLELPIYCNQAQYNNKSATDIYKILIVLTVHVLLFLNVTQCSLLTAARDEHGQCGDAGRGRGGLPSCSHPH